MQENKERMMHNWCVTKCWWDQDHENMVLDTDLRVWSQMLQHCFCDTFIVFFSKNLLLCGSVWIWCIDLFYPLYSFSKPLESFLGDDIENVEQGPLGSRSLQSANKGTQMINHSELTLSLLLEAWSRNRQEESGVIHSLLPPATYL